MEPFFAFREMPILKYGEGLYHKLMSLKLFVMGWIHETVRGHPTYICSGPLNQIGEERTQWSILGQKGAMSIVILKRVALV